MVESDQPIALCNVGFVGMTVMADNDCQRRRRKYFEQLADIFEEYAVNQTRWILDFADTLEKMLSNGYKVSELVDAPDHYTGVVCPRQKQNAGNKFYNCYHIGHISYY